MARPRIKTLTPAQKKVLGFILKYLDEFEFPPSYRDIGRELGMTSPATIWQHIHNLAGKGYLKVSGEARSIEPTAKAYQILGSKFLRLPLLGEIRAGFPLEAYSHPQVLDIPAFFQFRSDRDYFALKVKGDSMIEEGIFDGDLVICEKSERAQDGQVVVALIDNEATTLKKIYEEGNYIRLQPANPRMDPIIVRRVDIQGIVRAVIRHY